MCILLHWTHQDTSEVDIQHELHSMTAGIVFYDIAEEGQECQWYDVIPLLVTINIQLCLEYYWENLGHDLYNFLIVSFHPLMAFTPHYSNCDTG